MVVLLLYHLTGPPGEAGTLSLVAPCLNSFFGTRQILMHEKPFMIPIHSYNV